MNHTNAGNLLRTIARVYLKLQRAEVSYCDGTTYTQCFILMELSRSGPLPLSELGQRLELEKSWVSRAVEALVQAGLLVKSANEADGRSYIISLSKRGQKRVQELDTALNEHANRVMNRIVRQERAGVVKALTLLNEALQAETVAPPAPQTERSSRARTKKLSSR